MKSVPLKDIPTHLFCAKLTEPCIFNISKAIKLGQDLSELQILQQHTVVVSLSFIFDYESSISYARRTMKLLCRIYIFKISSTPSLSSPSPPSNNNRHFKHCYTDKLESFMKSSLQAKPSQNFHQYPGRCHHLPNVQRGFPDSRTTFPPKIPKYQDSPTQHALKNEQNGSCVSLIQCRILGGVQQLTVSGCRVTHTNTLFSTHSVSLSVCFSIFFPSFHLSSVVRDMD